MSKETIVSNSQRNEALRVPETNGCGGVDPRVIRVLLRYALLAGVCIGERDSAKETFLSFSKGTSLVLRVLLARMISVVTLLLMRAFDIGDKRCTQVSYQLE
jgi:hypothetical protein